MPLDPRFKEPQNQTPEGLRLWAGNLIRELRKGITAARISYDNDTSGLTAEDVQSALDEIADLNARIEEIFGPSAQGDVLVKGASAWGLRSPSNAGDVLTFDGTDTDFAAPTPRKVMALWDRTQGTNIGNMTGGGGIAAAWNGTVSQLAAASAQGAAGVGLDWIGKTFGSPQIPALVVCKAPSDWYFAGNQGLIDLELWVKNGTAPSNSTDGQQISVLGQNHPVGLGETRLTWSIDEVNEWDHFWIRVNNVVNATTYMGEMSLYTRVDA